MPLPPRPASQRQPIDITQEVRAREQAMSQWEAMPEFEADLEYLKNLDPKNPTESKVEQAQRLMLAAMAMAASNNEPYAAPMQLDPVDPQGYQDASAFLQDPFYRMKNLAPPIVPGPQPKGLPRPAGLPANPAMKPKMGY